ncbi:unnamed protein product [Lathyrus sativus]|nr:unnamed protein product [Lathyrus sativus]
MNLSGVQRCGKICRITQ